MKKIISLLIVFALLYTNICTAYFEDNLTFERTLYGNTFNMISNGSAIFVYGGASFVSYDGLNFKPVSISLSDVISVDGEFWGYNKNSLYTSFDGEHWQLLEENINISCMYSDENKIIICENINNLPYIKIYIDKVNTAKYAVQPNSMTIKAIVKMGNVYYSLIGGGYFYIYSSTDLQNWSRVGTKSYYDGSIVLTENRFYNIDGKIQYSDDGVNWITTSLTAYTISRYDDRQIAAFAKEGNNVYITNGEISFALSNNITRTSGYSFKILMFLNSNYIFLNDTVYKVENQTAINKFSIYGDLLFKKYTDICYGNGVFATIGTTKNDKCAVTVSTDGSDWKSNYIDGFPIAGLHLYFDGTKFIATSYGASSYTPKYAISTDAKNWALYDAPGSEYGTTLGFEIAYKDIEVFAIVSDFYKNKLAKIFKKTLNSDWIEVFSIDGYYFNDIKYLENELLVSGTGGLILSSVDGVHWNRQETNTDRNLIHLATKNNEILVFGFYVTSSNESLAAKRGLDGIWRSQTMPIGNFSALVTVTPYLFFRTVLMNLQQISDDGVNWRSLPGNNDVIWKYATNGEIIVEMAETYFVVGRIKSSIFSIENNFVSPDGNALNNIGNTGIVLVNTVITNPQKINLTTITCLYGDKKMISLIKTDNNIYDNYNKAVSTARFKNVMPNDIIKTFAWNSMNSICPIANK